MKCTGSGTLRIPYILNINHFQPLILLMNVSLPVTTTVVDLRGAGGTPRLWAKISSFPCSFREKLVE